MVTNTLAPFLSLRIQTLTFPAKLHTPLHIRASLFLRPIQNVRRSERHPQFHAWFPVEMYFVSLVQLQSYETAAPSGRNFLVCLTALAGRLSLGIEGWGNSLPIVKLDALRPLQVAAPNREGGEPG